MKWFFALNESCPTFSHYADVVKVAVHSALKYTSLVPHFLYDGEDNSLTYWLKTRNITLTHCRTPLFYRLREIAEAKQDPQILAIGGGAFLRIEVPRLVYELGIEDTYALYTDCDVMFIKDVTNDLEEMSCRYFAVAPEFDPKDYESMNTGVMLMNLKSLRRVDGRFRNFVISNLEKFLCWDQSAYQWFYRGPRDAFRYRHGWDRLPIEFNWKPYWGDYSRAKIIHFHGSKPFHRELMKSGGAPKILQDLAIGSYEELCVLWDRMLNETESS
jgi:lipopolysaccharide biosynthesis glycosyltransferase